MLTAQAEGAPTLTETAAQNLDLKRQIAELQLKVTLAADKDAKIQALTQQLTHAEERVRQVQQSSSSNETQALKKQVGDLERRLKHNADHFNQQLKVFIGINTQYERENTELRKQLAEVGVQAPEGPISTITPLSRKPSFVETPPSIAPSSSSSGAAVQHAPFATVAPTPLNPAPGPATPYLAQPAVDVRPRTPVKPVDDDDGAFPSS